MATISEVLDRIIKQYEPGAEFGKGERALLKRAKTRAMAGVGQQLAGAGLAGTTVGAGAAQRWEEEIGMPAELKLEDVRTERLVQALLAKAGFIQESQKMAFQASEARKQRQFQAQQTALARPSMAERGLTAFGVPFTQGLGGTRQPAAPAAPTPTTYGAGGAEFTVPGGYETDYTVPAGVPLGETYYGAAHTGGYKGLISATVSDEFARAPVTAGAPESYRVGGIATPTASQQQLISERLRSMYPGRGY